jgi:hypothetical protein
MLTIDSIDPSVKYFFFFLIDSTVSIIDQKLFVKAMAIDPSDHIQPIVSIHQSKLERNNILSLFFVSNISFFKTGILKNDCWRRLRTVRLSIETISHADH